MRIACWVLAVLILLGYALGAIAVWDYVSRADSTRGESLMVLPGVSFSLLWFGGLILLCVVRGPARFRAWEKRLLVVVALFGIALFPLLMVAEKYLLHRRAPSAAVALSDRHQD